jgi:hypothetical protein
MSRRARRPRSGAVSSRPPKAKTEINCRNKALAQKETSADILRESRTPAWAAHRDQEQRGSRINELRIQISSGKSHSTDAQTTAWRKQKVSHRRKQQRQQDNSKNQSD